MIRAFAAAALFCAAPARADMKTYSVGDGLMMIAYGDQFMGSRDGYHLARLTSGEDGDRWEKDGAVLVRAAKGVLNHGHGTSWVEPAALSADGKVLLHLMSRTGSNGVPGLSAAINGRPVGGVYEEIDLLRVSPRGANVAYAARDASGWSVHSGQGSSPSFAKIPLFLFVSDTETLYVAEWQGRLYQYRNGVPTPAKGYHSLAATPDLKRVGGTYLEPSTQKFWVDVDGVLSGPWADAGAVVFSDDGRHYVYLAEKEGSKSSDTVVVDGSAKSILPHSGNQRIDGAGVPYWCSHFESDNSYWCYRDGVKLGRARYGPDYDWVGFSPSGAHFAQWADKRLIVDGKIAEAEAPEPGDGMRIVFDGEKEFHYLTGDAKLVCVAVDGPSAANTRCAKAGRALDKSRAKAE